MTEEGKRPVFDAILLDPADTVATLLRPVEAGETLKIQGAQGGPPVQASEAIPLCHKIAVRDMPSGEAVRKYGQVIGAATGEVTRGSWVHVHNMASLRARKE